MWASVMRSSSPTSTSVGARDRAHVVRCQRRLGRHHRHEVFGVRIEVLGTVRRAFGVFPRIISGTPARGSRHGAVEVEVGPDQDHAIDEIRRRIATKRPTIPPSLHPTMCAASTDDLLEHADRLGRHVVVMERLVGVGGATMAATVEGHDAVVLGESGVRASSVSLFDKPPCIIRTVLSPVPRCRPTSDGR